MVNERGGNGSHGKMLLLIYGAGHFGKSLFWQAGSLLFAFFLTEIAELPPQQMGLVLSASLIANAFLDLIIGHAISGRVQSARSAASYQFFGAVAATIGFITFSLTGIFEEAVRLPYALVTVLIFRVGYSLYDVPQNAFMAFAAKDDPERASYGSTRYIASGAAVLVLTLLFVPLIRETDVIRQAHQFIYLSVLISVVSLGLSFNLSAYARKRLPLPSKTLPQAPEKENILQAPPARQSQTAFFLLLASIFIISSTSPFFSKLEAYFTAYSLKESFTAALFMSTVAIGKISMQPLWGLLGRRIELPRLFQIAAAGYGLGAIVFLMMAPLGGMVTLFAAFVFGAMRSGLSMSIWSLFAKIASNDFAHTTKKYGAFTFCSKMAQALSVLIIGLALANFDYSEADNQFILISLMTLIPLFGSVFIVIISHIVKHEIAK